MSTARLSNAVEFFKTELRWIGVVYDARGWLARLSFFNERKQDAENAVKGFLTPSHRLLFDGSVVKDAIRRYSAGGDPRVHTITLSPCKTIFQERVRKSCRKIAYGCTTTYGELARYANSPRGARAVGLCMKNNPIPIIVPCHRVLGAGDRLGGFSAGPGISLKKQLLRMEGVKRKFVN